MFYPLPLFVGLRYVRTGSRGFFVSFISWVSMLGVCVGVAALITILSVMNGMEGEIRSRMLSLASHATLSGPPERLRVRHLDRDHVRGRRRRRPAARRLHHPYAYAAFRGIDVGPAAEQHTEQPVAA